MWRVASTPPMPGMFRSITTTSGATSRTILSASWPAAASPTTWTPSSSSRLRSPLRNRSWSSTIRTRTSSSACSFNLAGVLILGVASDRGGRKSLVKRDRNGAPAPRECIGEGWKPEVDGVALNRAARVRRHALAVARHRVARRGDGQGARAGSYWDRGRGSRGGGLRLDRLRLLDDPSRPGVERSDLACVEPLLAGKRRDVGDVLGPRGRERRRRLLRPRRERLRRA